MLKIISGSEAEVKAEMKEKTAEIKTKIRRIRKQISEEKKQFDRDLNVIVKLENQLRDLEDELKFFSHSRVTPIQIENIVVNGKAINRFVKALKNKHVEVSLRDCLRFNYGVGYIEFHDLSEHYRGFRTIPKGVLENSLVESEQ